MAGKPPTVYGSWERGKKASRGPDPRWMESTAVEDIQEPDQIAQIKDKYTGEYTDRQNLSPNAIEVNGTKRLVNRGRSTSKVATGQTLPLTPVEFAVLKDDYVRVPTNTTDYQHPRTVAAAWDPALGTLTVVFRDSTFYNYYQVNKEEWDAFKDNPSPGKYIKEFLDDKPRGRADVSGLIKTFGENALKDAALRARLSQLREGYKSQGFKPTPINRRKSKPQGAPPSKGRGTYQPTTFNFGDL